MRLLLIGLLVIGFLTSLLLDWAINVLPTKELRRRTRSDRPNHTTAKYLYAFKSYGWVTNAFLWIVGTATAATLIVWSTKSSYVLTAAAAVLISLLTVKHRQVQTTRRWLWTLSGWIARFLAWLFSLIEPLLVKLPKSRKAHISHSRLYETEDLVDLINRQNKQTDNRISQEDLATARAALSFSDKTVASVMLPIGKVRIALPDETIGPHLMDELYESGYSSFPVGKKVGKKLPPKLQGTVYLKDLVASTHKQTVSQVATDETAYIENDRKLIEALETFIRAKTSPLIVTNEREEPVGALWLEDVLAQLLGRKVSPEADNPADADIRQIAAAEEKVVK